MAGDRTRLSVLKQKFHGRNYTDPVIFLRETLHLDLLVRVINRDQFILNG